MASVGNENKSPRTFRKKTGGGSFCCVPLCSNQSGNDTGQKRRYYRFPQQSSKQFKLWLAAIRRDDFHYKDWHRICSDHFKNGKKGHSLTDDGYVPTIFPFHKKINKRQSRTSGQTVISPLKQTNVTTYKRKVSGLNLDNAAVQSLTTTINNHDYLRTETENCTEIQKYLPEITEKIKRLEDAVQENVILKSKILDLEKIKENSKQIQFWTGFPNYATFIALFTFLEPRAKNMKYWRGSALSHNNDNFSKVCHTGNKPGPQRKLKLIDEFFLTLIRLKVGLLIEDLSDRFGISTGTVSSIFTSWIHLLYSDLKLICELPSNEVTSTNQSPAIGSFNDVQVILDCTELFIQNPTKLDVKKQFFSNYKHHMTYKFLIGISPQLGITFVSKMYGGRASDKFITSDSENLLHNLEVGKGSVMADRGFLVQGMLSDMGVKLHMPAFKGCNRPQFSANEAAVSEKISHVRIHIERAIQRIKTYHILDGELKLSMKDIAEEIFTVCAYLVNFQSPIVKA